MTTDGLRKALSRLHEVLRPPGENALTDGQLLARFVATRDEAAFAALVRRHGPMVLGVCRRMLHHVQDAEDAFQAAFLVLARKAGSVAKGEAVGSWLYRVSYRIALESKAINDRRRTREKQVDDMPHPVVMPAEPWDWQPWLDQELNRLPEKYRTPIVLCDLEGQTRKEAARQLKVPDGTLSSRLATGRRMLAKRLARYGLALSGGALAGALSEGAAFALPPSLASATVKAAVLIAAGELTAISIPVGILMKGAIQTMFLAKLKLVVGAVIVVMALGATGLAYRAAAQSAPPPAPKKDGKPLSELEALRKENELLKINLQVVLEKVRAQEAELRGLKAQAEQPRAAAISPDGKLYWSVQGRDAKFVQTWWDAATGKRLQRADALAKWVQSARDQKELQRAVDALEKALKELREQLKKEDSKPSRP